jgi:hypothetical protein
MRRTCGSVGAWFLATGLAVLVAWLGVRSVLFAAVPDRVEPMSAAEARRLAPPTTSPTALSPTPSESVSPLPTISPTAPTPTTTASVTVNPTPSDEAWAEVPDGRGGKALQRTFRVTGGAATILFSEREVRVTATAPAPGFTVNFDKPAPDVAIVTFTSAAHFSRIDAAWKGGARAKTTEGKP